MSPPAKSIKPSKPGGEPGRKGSPRPVRLFLIDSMNYIFRAYFALPRLSTRAGQATGAVYGFHNMLRKLFQDYQPEYVGAVFDLEGPTFRHESFADYKANREEMPDELVSQLPYIRQLLEAVRVPVLAHPGYEADDVIGTLARQTAARKLEVLIITSDKDMLQLVGERVSVINPMKDDLLCDRDKVIEIMGVAPEQVPDLLALQGDAVDNIPGAPGIGAKGARELIQKYGSVEACLEHAAEVSRKTYREALTNHRDQILLSKQLATIETEVPVELSLDAVRVSEPDREKLKELYQEMEFTSLLREFLPSADTGRKDYQELSSEDAVREFISRLPPDPATALAVRSEELLAANLTTAALSTAAGVGRSIPAALTPLLKPWLEDTRSMKAVHDAKSAHAALERQCIHLQGVRHDTMLYSYLLDATESSHELANLVERRFGAKLSGDIAEEADWVGQLTRVLEPEMEASGLRRLYDEIELPLAPILAEMEAWGVKLDGAQLRKLSVWVEGEVERLTGEIYKLTGSEFNINSPKQLGEVLFEKMGLPAPRKSGKSKSFSTAVDVLEQLSAVHEAPRRVLEYRQLSKLKSTYIDALPRLLNPASGRLHTSFNQAGTATGRLSSSNPNLQNIPIRTELGRKIRAAFVAEKGYLLLAADYSQIELRLLAHLSGDPLLVEAFRQGEDIHERTAAAVFGVPPDEQNEDHRRRAKAVNYGIVYGLSPFGLAQQLGISQAEAAEFIDQYFNRYQGVRKFINSTLAEVRRDGQVRTLFGRLRKIPDIGGKNPSLRQFAERTAINTPIQGGAADLMKIAMIGIDRALREQKSGARMLLQVHDEMVLEVPEKQVQQAAAVLRDGMEQVYALDVPLVANVSVGPNWRDMEVL